MLLVMYKMIAIKQLVMSFILTITMVSQLSTHQQVYIHPSSCLFPCRPYPRLLLYTDLVYTSKCYMRYNIVAIVTIFYFAIIGIFLLLNQNGSFRLLLIISNGHNHNHDNLIHKFIKATDQLSTISGLNY